MAEAEKTPNTVQATNKDGLFERLEALQSKYVSNVSLLLKIFMK